MIDSKKSNFSVESIIDISIDFNFQISSDVLDAYTLLQMHISKTILALHH